MKYAILLLLFLVGCCSSTTPSPTASVSGMVIDVQMMQEDSSHVYVLVRFDDKFIKLRSGYADKLEIPTGRLITITYDASDFKIQSVTPHKDHFNK